VRLNLIAGAILIPAAGYCGDPGLANLLREPGPVAAQAAVKALPAAAQTELFTLYARYNELVSERMEAGWRPGLISEQGVKASQDDALPARQLEEAVRSREAEIQSIEKKLEKPDVATVGRLRREREAAQARLLALRGALARAKGTCLDWSDLVWAELVRLDPEHWSISDRERAARPFHTGAALCSENACLVFDPWQRGQADAYEFKEWDRDVYAGRIPADFFLHDLPEPPPVRGSSKARR
jgi:hypothetical protein